VAGSSLWFVRRKTCALDRAQIHLIIFPSRIICCSSSLPRNMVSGIITDLVFIVIAATPQDNLSESYSYLSASIGFIRAAFHAGHKPKPTPSETETAKPTTGDQSGI